MGDENISLLRHNPMHGDSVQYKPNTDQTVLSSFSTISSAIELQVLWNSQVKQTENKLLNEIKKLVCLLSLDQNPQSRLVMGDSHNTIMRYNGR